MNIYQTIKAVIGDVEPISKGRRNQQQGFQYRGIDDVMNELQPIMAKHGLFVVPEVMETIREERQTKNGGALIYSILKIKYTFYADDGTSVYAIVIGEGMDSGDKASNKAMAVGMKYALLQAFCIPTEDTKDPDAECQFVQPKQTHPPKPAEPSPAETRCKDLVKQLDLTDELKAKYWHDSGKNWANLEITLKAVKAKRDETLAKATENVQATFGEPEQPEIF